MEENDAEEISGHMNTHANKCREQNKVQFARGTVSKIMEYVFDSVLNYRLCVFKAHDAM